MSDVYFQEYGGMSTHDEVVHCGEGDSYEDAQPWVEERYLTGPILCEF